jgi:dolichyl-phosphate-mannose--protein O-mannosyl transferase
VESGTQTNDQYFLNSEQKNLGSGSGQQIVTATSNPTTTDTLWWIRGPDKPRGGKKNACQEGPGQMIECGSLIRLTHINTMKNLHSHGMASPLSKQQEVSAYGLGDGKGDGGDDWTVICPKGSSKYWKREEPTHFQHVDTGKFLGASSTVKFTHSNCGHSCPILNHLEAFGRNQQDNFSLFVVEMGVHLSK